MNTSVPRLHVITDETLQDRYSHVELAEICVRAGADAIQYREKRDVPLRDRIATARSMFEICTDAGAMLVVNDFVDVALAIGAPAVHLGRTDEAIATVRRRLPPATLVGGTANSMAEARAVAQQEVDYVGVGPVFGTTSKASPAATLHVNGLAEICAMVIKPVIAIGNVQLQDIGSVLNAGAHGVAVISAIVCAEDVASATQEFCAALKKSTCQDH